VNYGGEERCILSSTVAGSSEAGRIELVGDQEEVECAASTNFAGERQLFLPVQGQQRSPTHHLVRLC
jgi:hypothetical protein